MTCKPLCRDNPLVSLPRLTCSHSELLFVIFKQIVLARLNHSLGKCDNPTMIVMTLQGKSYRHVNMLHWPYQRSSELRRYTNFNRVAVETLTLAIRMEKIAAEACHVTIQRYNGWRSMVVK